MYNSASHIHSLSEIKLYSCCKVKVTIFALAAELYPVYTLTSFVRCFARIPTNLRVSPSLPSRIINSSSSKKILLQLACRPESCSAFSPIGSSQPHYRPPKPKTPPVFPRVAECKNITTNHPSLNKNQIMSKRPSVSYILTK